MQRFAPGSKSSATTPNLVKPEDAPKSYADLLDPKWQGKIVKGHPGYSGAILTNTYLWVRELGWPYLEKLAQQKVMQLQSAADPPKKIAIGERAVMADGNDYSLEVAKEQKQPVEVVHPTEGSPVIPVPCGNFPQRAQSERRAAVSELPVQRRGAADLHRRVCAPLVPCTRQGKAGAGAAVELQAVARGSKTGAGAERGDQGALQQDIRGVMGLDRAYRLALRFRSALPPSPRTRGEAISQTLAQNKRGKRFLRYGGGTRAAAGPSARSRGCQRRCGNSGR